MLKSRLKTFIIFLVLGIVATTFGGILLHKQSIYNKTTATITQVIVTESESTDDNDYQVYVEYEVDGKQYNEQLPYYEDGYVQGKEVAIAYNPEDPSDIETAEKGFGIYLVIIGPIAILIGFVNLLIKR